MLMDIELDSGDILGLKYLKIDKDMVVGELFDKLANIASTLTIDILKEFDSLLPKKQNLSLVSHCGKIKKIDGLVDFLDATIFYNKYRAFKSWPDIYLESKMKIKECILEDRDSIHKKGQILAINKDNIIIGCEKGSIKIFRVQPSSKKEMNIIDYIRGKRLELWDILN